MLKPGLLERLRAWAEMRNAAASVWLFGNRVRGYAQHNGRYDFAIELRPTQGKHDWALAEYVAYSDAWRDELSRITRADDIRLVAFRDESDRPFDPADDGFLIWERTKPSGEVK